MKTLQMTELFSQYPCAYSLIAVLARDFPRERHVDCGRALLLLNFEGEDFSEHEVLVMLMACAKAGITIANERSESTGAMTWHVMPATLLESLKSGEPVSIPAVLSGTQSKGGSLTDSASRMLVQRFLLRSDCVIRVALPHDLSQEEVNRLTAYLETLVTVENLDIDAQSERAWPYDVGADEDGDLNAKEIEDSLAELDTADLVDFEGDEGDDLDSDENGQECSSI